MKWSNENTMEFLKYYQQNPVIWSRKHPNHKNLKAIQYGWMKIKSSLSFECTMDQLKNKKDTLMATFKRILRKLMARGVAVADFGSYNSDWFAYKTMVAFLLENSNQTAHEIQKPVHQLNNDQIESGIREKNEVDSTDRNDNIREDCNIAAQALKRPHEADESTNKRRKTSLSEDSDADTTNKNANIGETCDIVQASSSFIDTTQNRYDETHSMVVNKINKRRLQEKDEYTIYLDLLGTRIRSLDENIRKRLMLDIDNLCLLHLYQKYPVDQYQSSNEPMTN